jgi:beta-galactosidase
MLNDLRGARLVAFVENGGQLVLTVRSGMKDDTNALLPLRQPGGLTGVAGVEVEDYYVLPEPVPVAGEWFSGESRLWAERLKIRDEAGTAVIARYGASNGWLDGQAAITSHPYGKGRVYFVGAYLDESSQQALLDHIARLAGVEPVMETPAGVEACKRVGTQGEVFIIINHERTEKRVALPWPGREHLSGREGGELMLRPYGVAVVTRSS